MVVPFGFSFGDFVDGISLLKSLLDALNETFGAKVEYRGLISELYCLERALVAIKEIEVQEDSSEYDATQQAVRGCRECIDRFILRIATYQSLTAGTSSVKDHVRKITWSKCRQGDLQKFKADLSIYVSAINLLLNTLQLSYSKHSNLTNSQSIDRQTKILRQVEQMVKDSDANHDEMLHKIECLSRDSHAEPGSAFHRTFQVRPLQLLDAPIAPNFVPRPQIMLSIEEHLLPISPESQTLLVLSGPGGIGKSQMARSYAYKHQDGYDSIFWTNGKSKQSLRSSMARIAELIPLPQVLDLNQKVPKNEGNIDKALDAVESWLVTSENKRWLIIIDNVDAQCIDGHNEHNPQLDGQYDIAEHIPSVSQGSFLITSRLSLLANEIGARNLPIEEMKYEEALLVLHQASGRPYSETGAKELVHSLGAYPLALMQAAKYISEHHTTTQTYFQRYERDRTLLMNGKLARREYGIGSINVALGLSLKALGSRKPEAAAFLLLCGSLDNKDIFWNFFNTAYEFEARSWSDEGTTMFDFIPFEDFSLTPFKSLAPDWLNVIARDQAKYEEIVKHLYEFSFVRENEESDGFSIHSVIHEWLVSYCDAQTRSMLLVVAADVVAANFGAASEIPSRQIQPHADRCIKLGAPSGIYKAWSFQTFFFLGAFYYDNEEVSLAHRLIGFALEQVISTFGEESEMTTIWCMRVTPLYIRRRPVETIISELLAAKTRLTSSFPPTSGHARNLVDVGNHICYAYQIQGDFTKSIAVGESVLESAAFKDVDLTYTCCATGLLAENYLTVGKYQAAKSYANVAVRQHEDIFGVDPKDGSLSAWRRRNLTIMAIACAHIGDLELAEVLLASVHVEAVRYTGADDDLSKHAEQNLKCILKIKAGLESNNAQQQDSMICSTGGELDPAAPPHDDLKSMSTDRNVHYLRFDLAMGLFETLGYVGGKIRARRRYRTSGTSNNSFLDETLPTATPLSSRLAAAGCTVQ